MLRFLIFTGLVNFAFVVFSQNKTTATITSSDEDDVVCSSELILNPVVLTGSAVQFPEAPFNEYADWMDLDGALGTAGEVYNTPSLVIDKALPAGEYEFVYSVFNDQHPNNSAALYTLTVHDVPDMPIIGGLSEACESTTSNYSVQSVDNSLSYAWEVVGGDAVISDGQDSSVVNIKFDKNVAISGSIGESVTIGLKANNQCGFSLQATQEVQINLKPRKADYAGTELVYESGISAFCESEVSGQIIKLNTTANFHNRYFWLFNYTDFDSTEVNSYSLMGDEIKPAQDGNNEFSVFVILGNSCGYGEAYFMNETPFVEKQNFSVAASILEKEIITDVPYTTYPVCGIGSLFDLKVKSENEKALQNVPVELEVYYTEDTVSFPSLSEDELMVSSVAYTGSDQLIVKASIDSSASCFTNFTDSDTIRFMNYEFEYFSILASQTELCEGKGQIELSLSSEQLTDNGNNKIKNIVWELPSRKTIKDNNKIALNKNEQSGNVKVSLQNQYNCDAKTDSLDVLIHERLVPELYLSGASDICTEEETQYQFSVPYYTITYKWKLDKGSILEGEDSSSVVVELDPINNNENSELLLETVDDNNCMYDFRYILNSNCNPFLSLNEETSYSQLELYPNPFTTSFNLTGIQDFDKIEVFNLSGQLVESYFTKNDLGERLEHGTYLIKIHTSSGIEVRKLMKQ